jgi:hypothetical protein
MPKTQSGLRVLLSKRKIQVLGADVMVGRWSLVFPWVVALFLVGSCVTDDGTRIGNSPRESGVCPEYQDLSCLSRVICETDKRRGCKVCYCEPAYGATPSGDPTPNSNLPE